MYRWPVTQTGVYLAAYHPARGPHTVLPLSAWLWCRYWQSQSIVTSPHIYLLAHKLLRLVTHKLRGEGEWKERVLYGKTTGPGSGLDPSYNDSSAEQAPFVTSRALGKRSKQRPCVFIRFKMGLFPFFGCNFTDVCMKEERRGSFKAACDTVDHYTKRYM